MRTASLARAARFSPEPRPTEIPLAPDGSAFLSSEAVIPLRDANPSSRFPVITVAIIVINTLVYAYESTLGPSLKAFIAVFGLVPGQITYGLQSREIGFLAALQPFVTSMFLHGSWLHLIGNMWFLWIFGDNVEDMLGGPRYIAFYLLAGLGAGAAHYFTQPTSAVPTVGASGAIAGVLAGYMILFPHARVTTLVPLGFFVRIMDLPAMVLILIWFALQILSGALSGGTAGGGVAWWAHVGGFVVGAALVRVLTPRRVMA